MAGMGMGMQSLPPPMPMPTAVGAAAGEEGGRGGGRGRGDGGGDAELKAKVVFEGAPPVYEWWFGDRPPQGTLDGVKPRGFWKRYHPAVCRKLEAAWQGEPGFKSGEAPTDVDGVMYMIQRIMDDRPWTGPVIGFDAGGGSGGGLGGGSGGGGGGGGSSRGVGNHPLQPSLTLQKSSSLEVNLPEELHMTVDHPCFDKLDAITGNCMVQFHKGNILRRRPARRRINAEEIARNAARTGEPCFVCYSEDGEVTGCKMAADGHVICRDCLRMSLRSLAGDILTTTNLLCGCFGFANRGPIMVLAERADKSLSELLASPPTDPGEVMQLEMEIEATRQQFGLMADGTGATTNATAAAAGNADANHGGGGGGGVAGGNDNGSIPPDLYRTKVAAWFDKVQQMTMAPLYHLCLHPDCATKIEHWILRTDFDTDYRAKGQLTWICPADHRNSVLPTDDEIREVNRNILFHPEFYTASDAYDHCPMRRYRLCPGCVHGGSLMMAAHDDGCKQWPGGGGKSKYVYHFRLRM